MDVDTDAVRYGQMVMYNAVAILPIVLLRIVASYLNWWDTVQLGDLVDYRPWRQKNRTWIPAQVGCCYEAERCCWITFADDDGAIWTRVVKIAPEHILPAVLAFLSH